MNHNIPKRKVTTMTRIIAVRHAQSEGNIANFCCGHTDVALTPAGHMQAAETARYIAERYGIDRIYSSDLMRVVMTARPTAARYGLEIIPTKDLREINVGEWEGLPQSEANRIWIHERDLWKHDFVNAFCPGGESVRELFARIRVTFRRLAEENPNKTIAIFTHATPVRVMLTEWQGLPLEAVNDTPWPDNASVTVVDYLDDGGYIVYEKAYDEHLQKAGLLDSRAVIDAEPQPEPKMDALGRGGAF